MCCRQVGDSCDNCNGGDDNGPCDGETFPDLDNIPSSWVCDANGHKVYMCHEGNIICVDYHAVNAHWAHGDFLGPFTGCENAESATFNPGQVTHASNTPAEFTVYPDPSNGDIRINMNAHHGTIHIYDQRGQLTRSLEGAEYQRSDLTLPQSGMYIIQLTTGVDTITKKITVIQ